MAAGRAVGQADAHAQRADGNQHLHRRAPGAGAGEIDKVQDDAARLAVEVAVDQAGVFDAGRQIAGSISCIPHERGVIQA